MKDYEMTFALQAALDATFPNRQQEAARRQHEETERVIASGKASIASANKMLEQIRTEKEEALRKLREAGFGYSYGDTIIDIGIKLQSDLFSAFYDMDKHLESKNTVEETAWERQAVAVYEELTAVLNKVRQFNSIVPYESQIRPI